MIRITDETLDSVEFEIQLVADIVAVVFSPDYFKSIGLEVVGNQSVVDVEVQRGAASVGGEWEKDLTGELLIGGSKEKKKAKREKEYGMVPYAYFESFVDYIRSRGPFSLTDLFGKRTRKPEEEEAKSEVFNEVFKKKEDEPVEQATKPVEDPTKPVEDPAKPVEDPAKPVEDPILEVKPTPVMEEVSESELNKAEVPSSMHLKEPVSDATVKKATEGTVIDSVKSFLGIEPAEEPGKPPVTHPVKGKAARIRIRKSGPVTTEETHVADFNARKANDELIEASPVDGTTVQQKEKETYDIKLQWENKTRILHPLGADENSNIRGEYERRLSAATNKNEIFYIYANADAQERDLYTKLDFRLFRMP